MYLSTLGFGAKQAGYRALEKVPRGRGWQIGTCGASLLDSKAAKGVTRPFSTKWRGS